MSRRGDVATCGPDDEVGLLSQAAAGALQATEAKQQVARGDGADWSTPPAQAHFPEAVKLLDWPHLWRTVRAAVRSGQPGKRAARSAWRTEQEAVLLPLLWQGDPVGSGLVERAVARVLKARMNKRGRRCKRAHATAVVALRVARSNADWDAAA